MRFIHNHSLPIPYRASRSGFRSGLTLVELLVVTVISMIVVAVLFTLHRVTASYYVREDARLEQMQNLRVALYTIARDVRMAGSSSKLLGPLVNSVNIYVPGQETLSGGKSTMDPTPGWYTPAAASAVPGALPIFGIDGGSTDPDTLTLFRAEPESVAPVGSLSSQWSSKNKLNLVKSVPKGSLDDGDIIVIVNVNNQAVLLEVGDDANDDVIDPDNPGNEIPLRTAGRFSPNSLPSFVTFPEGSYVYNLRDAVFVTYYLDETNHNLMADYHDNTIKGDVTASGTSYPTGTVIVATNIDDFQVFYYWTDTNKNVLNGPVASDTNDLTMDPDTAFPVPTSLSFSTPPDRWVCAVVLGLVARSPRPEENMKDLTRPALFNRAAGTVEDRYPRLVLTETIDLRNF